MKIVQDWKRVRGCTLLAKLQPNQRFGKLADWVRKTPKLNYFIIQLGGVAQLGEHLPCKQGVRSSNLLISTNPNTTKTSKAKFELM